MRAIRGRDTGPERNVRSLLHALGYRFRLHSKWLPGSPDIVFQKRRKVVFVHGCFWHDHPGCPKAYKPKSRREFWEEKFRRNRERDAASEAALAALNWSVLVVWECEAGNAERITDVLTEFLGPPSEARQPAHDRPDNHQEI